MLTMVSALERAQRLFGARRAIIDREGEFTWSEFFERVTRVAGILRGLGVRQGDRYAILCRNTFRHAELIHAGYWMGAIPVPVNYRLAAPEIRFILEDADCKFLIVEDALIGLIAFDELAQWRDRILYVAPENADVEWPQYEALLASTQPIDFHPSAEDDDAILLYTGGTTGRSKGVRLSHGNVFSNGMQVTHPMGIRSDDVYFHLAPMFHSADLLGTCFTQCGAAHSYLAQFTPVDALSAIQDFGITVAMMAPTMIILTLQDENFDEFDLSSFRLLFYGSSPMAVEWIRRAMERFKGVEIQQGYGLTETSPILTTLDPMGHQEALDSGEYGILRSVGRPLVSIDLRIVDDENIEVPFGEAGEVVVRGPNVTKGYLNRPEENERAFRDGWFHTGDVGSVDKDGNMYLLDRKKDMIITGGENVYSSEVEAALYQHPGVNEAAVVGVPDEKYGEALFAVIVPAPGANPTEDEIIAHCRERIGGYKIPRRMAFIDEMPKSAMGKILKTELRRMFGGTTSERT
ncbi:MAG: long-chain-fatty-acid--CoA ligase [Pseudomonadota bacterium]|nr:long-chain-fatty-acid--CoA ligase [Pseudomonadota bacterium]